jgi:phosphohistidine swiveling domain-containing protein
MRMATAVVGKGQPVSGSGCDGVIHRANEVEEVFRLMKASDLDETILLTDSPSATALVPLLAKVRGLVCRSGGMTSHLAIVSREFGLPCVMGASIDQPAELEGQRVRIDADGQITRA